MSTTRVALTVSYNGTDFHGFQYQRQSIPTIQGHLETALTRVADHEIKLVCAGRTDTGVHATHQVVHFDTTANRDAKAWIMGGNSHLPDTINIAWAGRVNDDFDARFAATARRYFYVIYNHPVRSALMASLLTKERRPLDEAVMDAAGQALVGEHDFSSFRASGCQSPTPVRDIHRLSVYRIRDLVVIDITANAFLHHMVRNIAGVLMDIGRGDAREAWAAEVLARRDRRCAGLTAPPHGLYLVDVSYPDHFGIPAGPELPHLYAALLP
ncbi:MAG TPA: tRNA pseudouridine(38-40) synthase TruA [Pseudomonadales bacterium]|nr:tRNA pseudouridine(38-40) synthase TruA [Pseudomonadales bacterium]